MTEREREPGPIERSLTDAKQSYLDLATGGKRFAEAAGSLVPGVSAIGMIIGGIRDLRVANLEDVARTLDRVIEDQHEWVDHEFLKTKEAHAFIADVLTASARLSEESKRAFYASAFRNGVVKDRSDEATRYRMIDVLERLRLPALQLFGAARGNNTFEIPFGTPVDLTADNGFLQRLAPEERFDRLVLDWQDLRRAGLVEVQPILGSPHAGYSKFITTFGLEFDLFVRTPYNDVHLPPDPGPEPSSDRG